jgi:hypothetical protein
LSAAVIIGALKISKAVANSLFPNIELNKQAKTNFEYLKKKDIKKLIRQFSENAQNSHNLTKEFEDFYASIDGQLVSYENVNCADSEKYVDSWKTTKHLFVCEYKNVKTDTGATYEELSYSIYKINKYHPSAVGINTLSLINNENELVVGLKGEDFDLIQQ